MGEPRDDRPEWAESLVDNALRRMRFGAAALQSQAPVIASAGAAVASSLRRGGTVLVCGNGGSAAAAQHFAAEFTGKLALDRPPMPAIALTVDTSAMTAIANDYSYDEVFARQVTAFAGPGDVVVGLSTSGTSRNVVRAIEAAAEAGATSIALTGAVNRMGGDIAIEVPLRETARVQEAHDLVLHEIAQIAERLVLPELGDDASADRFPFLLTEDDIPGFRSWMRDSQQVLVTTNGVFDLLHEGHHASLTAARLLGDRLVVLINSDASTKRLKGETRPTLAIDDRVADLARTPFVDHVVVMEDDGPARLLGLLQPDVHAKGAEYRERGLPEAAVVEDAGGRVEYIELRAGYSTSAVLARLQG